MIGEGTKAGAAKSPWIQHVKSYMVTHNCTYKQALSGASESYKKRPPRQVVPRGRSIRAISPPPDTKMSDMRIRAISPPRKSKAVEALAQRITKTTKPRKYKKTDEIRPATATSSKVDEIRTAKKPLTYKDLKTLDRYKNNKYVLNSDY